MFVDVHFWTTVILIKIPMDFLNSKHIELLFTVGLKAEFAVNFVTSTILLIFLKWRESNSRQLGMWALTWPLSWAPPPSFYGQYFLHLPLIDTSLKRTKTIIMIMKPPGFKLRTFCLTFRWPPLSQVPSVDNSGLSIHQDNVSREKNCKIAKTVAAIINWGPFVKLKLVIKIKLRRSYLALRSSQVLIWEETYGFGFGWTSN